MIPYFNISTFHLGPITVHTWGFVVSLGFAVAILVAYRRARRTGLEGGKVLDLAFWILVAAFLGARLFHVFFYEWHYYSMHLKEIVRIDQGGLSSFGGFIGAAIAFALFTHRHHLDRFRYADVLMFAWPLGHGIGRIGCYLVHMHPGRLSMAPWAVQYPDGPRLDMGLIESAVLLSYWIIIAFATKRRRPPLSGGSGFYLVSGMIFYGTVRFMLDFFRATEIEMADTRYFGLTPAQYGSIMLVVLGIAFASYRKTMGTSAPTPPPATL